MEKTAELAGFLAAHAVLNIYGGGPLTPILGYQKSDGQRHMLRLAAEKLEQGVAMGHDWLAKNPENAERAVLISDGFATLSDGRADALIIEAHLFVPKARSFQMALPYRPINHSRGFGVHRPKFLGAKGPKPDFNVLGQAFFRGVEGHAEGDALWRKYLDESR